jgi:hypothetical protein
LRSKTDDTNRLRRLGDIRRDPSRLIARQQLGRWAGIEIAKSGLALGNALLFGGIF